VIWCEPGSPRHECAVRVRPAGGVQAEPQPILALPEQMDADYVAPG
jgi:hypothetical protein